MIIVKSFRKIPVPLWMFDDLIGTPYREMRPESQRFRDMFMHFEVGSRFVYFTLHDTDLEPKFLLSTIEGGADVGRYMDVLVLEPENDEEGDPDDEEGEIFY